MLYYKTNHIDEVFEMNKWLVASLVICLVLIGSAMVNAYDEGPQDPNPEAILAAYQAVHDAPRSFYSILAAREEFQLVATNDPEGLTILLENSVAYGLTDLDVAEMLAWAGETNTQ